MTILDIPKNMPLEGYFYPDTYLYTINTTNSALLKRSDQHMEKIIKIIWHVKLDCHIKIRQSC